MDTIYSQKKSSFIAFVIPIIDDFNSKLVYKKFVTSDKHSKYAIQASITSQRN